MAASTGVMARLIAKNATVATAKRHSDSSDVGLYFAYYMYLSEIQNEKSQNCLIEPQ